MPVSRPSKISNKEWEDQKLVIWRLYVREKRGLRDEGDQEGVMTYMSREKDFNAKLSQYEARLKHWGYRKSISKSDWIKVAKVIQERATQGKRSVVFVSGEPLEDSQVRKGISRPAVRDAIRDNIQDSPLIYHLPSYVEVLTPKLGPRGDDQQAEGPSIALDYSPYLRVGHDLDLNGSDEISNTVSHLMPDIETEPIRSASPTETYSLDHYQFDLCASPISAGDSANWIKTVTKEKLIHQLKDTFSLLSDVQGKDQPSSQISNFMTEIYQEIIRNIFPVRYSYNLEHKTQSAVILQIAIHHLVNGNIQGREEVHDLRSIDYDKRPTVAHRNLNYSKPIIWALSYFQRGSMRLLQRLRKCLPSPYLEALYRSLFTVALEADAYEILEGLLDISKTALDSAVLSMVNIKNSVSLKVPLERIFADGPLSLARLILHHTARSLSTVNFKAGVGHLDPVEKIRLMISGGIVPDWTHILQKLIWSQNTAKIRQVMDDFTHWRTDLDSFNSSTLIIDLMRYISEADALPIIETILKEIQPATLEWLKNPWANPNSFDTRDYDILLVAVARQYDAVIDLLMSAGFQGNGACLCEAICGGRMDLVERLLDYSVPDRSTTLEAVFTAIKAASEIGNEAILSRFLQSQLAGPQSMSNLHVWSYDWSSCLTKAAELAAKNNHANVLALLVQVGTAPSAPLFQYAIGSQDEDMIIQLFECDIENSRPSSMRYHGAILAAIDRGDQRILSAVLDCVDLRHVDRAGDFLSRAIHQNNLMLVKDLIHRGVSPDAQMSANKLWDVGDVMDPLETPLIVAIRKRYNDITTYLLENGASMNPSELHESPLDLHPRNRYVSALEQAAAMHDTRLIQELLRRGAEPYDSRAIMLLDKIGDRASLDMLLEINLALPRKSKTSLLSHALMTAVRSGNIHLLHRLLPHVDTEAMFAEEEDWKGKGYSRAWMTSSRFDPQPSRLNILSFAMYSHARKHCSMEIFRSILGFGSDPEAICLNIGENVAPSLVTTKGRSFTPIQNAILLNLKPCIDMLIDSGANINRQATNVTYRTALQLAVEIGYAEMVSYLISKGAHVNAPPAPLGGFTALQLAAKHGLYRIAELLIDAKAEVDAPGAKIDGRTAFEAATENGRLDMMGFLVKNGALSENGEQQYERAVRFAKVQGQDPAVEYAGQLRAKLLEATRAAEKEYQELMEYPMPGLDT